MIPYEVEKDFKTILNAFKRLGKGIYKNEKDAMQNIYKTTEMLFQNNVSQNPLLVKLMYLLIEQYIHKYGTAKQAIFMLVNNLDKGEDLFLFRISDLINTYELQEIIDAVDSGIINEGQQEAILKACNKWTKEKVKKSTYSLANDLIFNERINEL